MKTAKGNVHLYVSHNLRIDNKILVVVSLFSSDHNSRSTFIILFIFVGLHVKIYLYT